MVNEKLEQRFGRNQEISESGSLSPVNNFYNEGNDASSFDGFNFNQGWDEDDRSTQASDSDEYQSDVFFDQDDSFIQAPSSNEHQKKEHAKYERMRLRQEKREIRQFYENFKPAKKAVKKGAGFASNAFFNYALPAFNLFNIGRSIL